MAIAGFAPRLPTACIVGALAVAGAGYTIAGQIAPATDVFRTVGALTDEPGSKHAVGYFKRQNGKCRLTLFADSPDHAQRRPHAPARFDLTIGPGESAAFANDGHEERVFTCGTGAWTVEVRRISASRS